MTEVYAGFEFSPSGSISVAYGISQFSLYTRLNTFNASIFINEIKVGNETVLFKRPLVLITNYSDEGDLSVDDDSIWIHESDSNYDRLVEKVKEDLEIQWEDIVMADDSKLYKDAIELKKYLLSLV